MTPSPPDAPGDAEVMRLWRECGLPEYFLGSGGTNHKLVAFAKACRADEAALQRVDAVLVAFCEERGISAADARKLKGRVRTAMTGRV
jgi:hypothetical protein